MIPDAARMRRWILQGAPIIAAAALGMHAGGAAAGMFLWLLLGWLILPRGRYPYPRKRAGNPWRLFFAFSAGLLMLCGLDSLLLTLSTRLFSAAPLTPHWILAGAVLFSFPFCASALQWPLPIKWARALSGIFCFLSGVIIFYR